MKKIPSLFVRDYENPNDLVSNGRNKGRFLATREVTPGCEWVIAGEGVATRKWDGTAVMVKDGMVYKRYDAKHGKTPPDGFEPCQEPDPLTGHWPGWIKLDHMNRGGADKWIWEAFWNTFPVGTNFDPGTYEAIGPKINGNKDKWDQHELRHHGDVAIYGVLGKDNDYRSYDGLYKALSEVHVGIEGIVFHHPDGRMCKVKRSDFGLKW